MAGTSDWLQSVVGKFSFTPRLLAWDAYRGHISAATKAELKCGYNVTTAVIPGGCTKYIQAPDVMWNQPFKQSLHEAYDIWMAGDSDKDQIPTRTCECCLRLLHHHQFYHDHT